MVEGTEAISLQKEDRGMDVAPALKSIPCPEFQVIPELDTKALMLRFRALGLNIPGW